MTLGIFTKTFLRPNLGETLDAIRRLSITHVQFNTPPEDLSPARCHSVRHEFEQRGIALEVLSATFNIIHPDKAIRKSGFDRFTLLAQSAKRLGTNILSVSTGTCDPDDMWRKHPCNDTSEAWREMLTGMSTLAAISQEQNVIIAFEPEQANIIDTAQKARTVLNTLRSPHVKILIDAANLLTPANLPQQDRVLNEAFDLLGADIVLAHAKEISAGGQLGNAALGTGVVNFPLYVSLLEKTGFRNSLIMHGFPENVTAESMNYLSTFVRQ